LDPNNKLKIVDENYEAMILVARLPMLRNLGIKGQKPKEKSRKKHKSTDLSATMSMWAKHPLKMIDSEFVRFSDDPRSLTDYFMYIFHTITRPPSVLNANTKFHPHFGVSSPRRPQSTPGRHSSPGWRCSTSLVLRDQLPCTCASSRRSQGSAY
jgi:hypothetical protein